MRPIGREKLGLGLVAPTPCDIAAGDTVHGNQPREVCCRDCPQKQVATDRKKPYVRYMIEFEAWKEGALLLIVIEGCRDTLGS